jgi:membrane-associated phospholipid phosphatase
MRRGTRAGARLWPTGRSADLAFQAAIWLGFVFGYQVIQAGAGQHPGRALANGLSVAELERDLVHGLVELHLQELARDSGALDTLVSLTYWSSEFAVVALALLWVYLRRPGAFPRFRNTLIVTNVIALIGFYAFPTAPPRRFPSLGFIDTVRSSGAPGHGHGLLPVPSNQYAAMPSLHSADALIVGVGLALLVRSRAMKAVWLLWPLAVWFSVLATGNHFWLDIVGGIVVAGIGGLAVTALRTHRPAWPGPAPNPSAPGKVPRAALGVFRLQRNGSRGKVASASLRHPAENGDGKPFPS